MNELTLKQQATNYETMLHIARVRYLLGDVAKSLISRGDLHDLSKLNTPEVEIFSEVTERLAGMTYGSEEYLAALKDMKPALDHHYDNNRHHPEHFQKGINGMNLVDLIEMLCDWVAATERHDDGDIMRSIRINKERFGISDQLAEILVNTVYSRGWE